MQIRANASYDGLKSFSEGQAVICFGSTIMDAQVYYSNPGHAKAMRVTRFMSLAPHKADTLKNASSIARLRDRMVKKNWTAAKSTVVAETPDVIANLAKGFKRGEGKTDNFIDRSIYSIVDVYAADNVIDMSTPAPAVPSAAVQEASAVQQSQPTSAQEAVALEKTHNPVVTEASNPMGFFSKGKKSEEEKVPEGTVETVSQDDQSTVKRVQDSDEDTSGDGQQPEAISHPENMARKTASKEALSIIKKAGEDAAKVLFKSKEDA